MAVKKPMVCIDCHDRIDATIPQAQAHGWVVWVGGARCKSCVLIDEMMQQPGDPKARVCAECFHTERWHRERCLGSVPGGACPYKRRCECPGFRASEQEP